MKIWSDYNKVLHTIESCETVEQVKSAARFLTLWYKKYLDYHVYKNTTSIVEDKFFKLGGEEAEDLYEVLYKRK